MLDPVPGIRVGDGAVDAVAIGGGAPMVLIAGPCVIETPTSALRIARAAQEAARDAGIPFIFKASFDKANRTSLGSFRGPGLSPGLEVLQEIRGTLGVPVTTDVHHPEQAATVAAVVDLLQVPAFLCRQTDLLVACAKTGRPVNVKKGQFLAPPDVRPLVAKLRGSGGAQVMVTERGASFGYRDLVVDMRSLPTIRAAGVPVCLDATHGVQRPGAGGDHSGGDRHLVPFLARAGVAAGVDALFLEVHDAPAQALSDASTMLDLAALPELLAQVVQIDRVVRG